MESRTNFYPVYVSGQYLTSEHLNETHNFLWEEEKATRYLLIGNGVAHGLNADFTGSSILQTVSVTAGVASTIDGYLINAPANIQFNKGVSVNLVWYTTTDGNQAVVDQTTFDLIKSKLQLSTQIALTGIELLAATLDPAELPDGNKNLDVFAITANNALNNYIVMAFVENVQLANNHCQQGDCNTKGIQNNLNIRYCLIPNSQVTQQNTITPEIPLCAVARIKNLAASGSKAGLNQKTYDAWNKSVVELSPYFTDNSGKQLKIVATILGAASLTALNASITKFGQIKTSVSNTACPQYYVAFADDLAKAINELLEFYNVYSRKYHTYGNNRIGKTAILGKLRSTGIDSWRYYFISDLFNNEAEAAGSRLNILFNRVLAMVDNFILANSIGSKANAAGLNPPRQTPTIHGTGFQLQHCAIPYYYDIALSGANNTLLKNWNPNGGNLKDIYCYYDPLVRTDMKDKLLNASWANSNFFLIEGHVGMSKATAIANLNKLISDEGLPIQLIDCDISYKGATNWTIFYDFFLVNMQAWAKELRSDYSLADDYRFPTIKKIQDELSQTSYRNMDQVTKLVNDLNAYNGVFQNTAKAQKMKVAAKSGDSGTSNVIGIPDLAYDRYKEVVQAAQMKELNEKLKAAQAEVNDTTTQKQVIFGDLKDIEYLGGAPRGGTFVLIHDGTTVLGDGCLPYYYRVNTVRVY